MATRESDNGDRVLLDLNTVVIATLADHPGHDHVQPHVERGFRGETRLLLFDYYPFRAQYILTGQYDIDNRRARNAIQRFVRQPMEVVSAERETILDAYDVSAEKNHDAYDCFLVALAREHNADVILTTDEDFDALCHGEPFDYHNPVPRDVIEQFADGI